MPSSRAAHRSALARHPAALAGGVKRREQECLVSSLDVFLFLCINADAASPPWVIALARLVTLLLVPGTVAGALLVALAGPLAWRRRALWMLLSMLFAWSMVFLIRHLVDMPRPFQLGLGHKWLAHSATAGFPSMHAAVAFAIPLLMPWRRWPALRWLLWLVACLVAWSRVSLGLHFPSDVAAGASLGLLSSLALRLALLRLLPLRRRLWRHLTRRAKP